MKTFFTLIASFVLLSSSLTLGAQDLHNTLFYMNPLHMNPAFSGAYEGTYRIGGIYRDQARSVVTNAYSTPTLFIDAPVVMLGKRHWLGVGGLMFRDQAGDGKLQMNSFQLSGALHLAMDKKSQNIMTIGVQWGQVQRQIKDRDAFILGDFLEEKQNNVLNPKTNDPFITQNSGQDDLKKNFTDVNAGILFTRKGKDGNGFNAGFSVRHITRPSSVNFEPGGPKQALRLIGHAQLTTNLDDKWSVTPELYYTNMDKATQFQVHGWAGYKLNPEKRIQLNFGLGYRSNDAGQLLLGMDYGDIKAAIAYDVTLSQLNEANNYKGGFELSVYYIGKIYKKPEVKPVILCPHL
ncbi:MAG: hypothetical protein KatS3mg029_0955 [Saprospiraceae bacterium]|nr:MAG: hypothetical protein KatS3mg029_0955 [Saprospiraceae bacterium]